MNISLTLPIPINIVFLLVRIVLSLAFTSETKILRDVITEFEVSRLVSIIREHVIVN